MLSQKILNKLESLTNLPTIPYVISEVLNAVDNTNISAGKIGRLIEKDQALTVKVLSVANSPFYGFSRKISTIDLAIVVIGLNSIKEIVLSLVIQKFFASARKDIFDINRFWKYSVFSGACSRVLARKLGYKLAGEAFVIGLMHDIGILILSQFFSSQFNEIRNLQKEKNMSLVEAEIKILECSHCDIGAWFCRKWNLPEQLHEAILNHHTSYLDFKMRLDDAANKENIDFMSISFADTEQPLTVIVALAEWFAGEMGFKDWALEKTHSPLFLASEIIEEIREHDVLSPESALEIIKQEIIEEYEKAEIFNKLPAQATYF